MTVQTVESQGRSAELLLVEDNYGDVLLTCEAFRAAKIRNNLSVAVDGEEALHMLRREPPFNCQPRPDLILLDLNLPRLGGREVLAQIKADPELQRIPVIVMSSSSAEVDVLRSYQLNANGYVVKPIDFERLQEIVATIEAFWFTVVVQVAPPALVQTRAA